ncbi:MAG: hypothetical protein ACE5KE_05150 [Methanosarcinales archaeon]
MSSFQEVPGSESNWKWQDSGNAKIRAYLKRGNNLEMPSTPIIQERKRRTRLEAPMLCK